MNSTHQMTLRPPQALRGAVAVLAVLTVSACAISQQREVEMGASYATELEKQLPLIHDPEIVAYINVLGDSLVRMVDDRSLTWHFSVVNSRDLNAFAVPGGYVYINRGIVERATSMAQVAGVLGHEIGHVTRRHGIQQTQKARGAAIGMALGCVLTKVCSNQDAQTGINLAANAIFAKFGRDHEHEADAEGVTTLVRARIDPVGMTEMFRILLEERTQRPDGVATFFASHPLEEDRITSTMALIAQQPAASLRDLTKDSPDFQAFRQRILALPAPPGKRQ